MDREPYPLPEFKYEDVDEHVRGISLLLEVEEVDENGLKGFLYENGELLLAREEDAILAKVCDSLGPVKRMRKNKKNKNKRMCQ